jgi:hypothetical protein
MHPYMYITFKLFPILYYIMHNSGVNVYLISTSVDGASRTH